jgi:hypothetical protein
MGFSEPVDHRIEVYIMDIGPLGITYYNPSTGQIWMKIDIGLDSDPAGGPNSLLQTVVAHEVMHAVQTSYDIFEGGWIIEGTATWMMDEVYDGQNSLYLSWANFFMSTPDRSLPSLSYDSVLYWKLLSESYGGFETLKKVLEATRVTDGVSAVDDGLTNVGTSLRTTFIDWVKVNWKNSLKNKNSNLFDDPYEQGDLYNDIAVPSNFRITFTGVDVERSGSVSTWASDYMEITPQTDLLRISFDGDDNSDFMVKVILVKDSSVAGENDVDLDGHQNGYYFLSSAREYSKIAIAIARGGGGGTGGYKIVLSKAQFCIGDLCFSDTVDSGDSPSDQPYHVQLKISAVDPPANTSNSTDTSTSTAYQRFHHEKNVTGNGTCASCNGTLKNGTFDVAYQIETFLSQENMTLSSALNETLERSYLPRGIYVVNTSIPSLLTEISVPQINASPGLNESLEVSSSIVDVKPVNLSAPLQLLQLGVNGTGIDIPQMPNFSNLGMALANVTIPPLLIQLNLSEAMTPVFYPGTQYSDSFSVHIDKDAPYDPYVWPDLHLEFNIWWAEIFYYDPIIEDFTSVAYGWVEIPESLYESNYRSVTVYWNIPQSARTGFYVTWVGIIHLEYDWSWSQWDWVLTSVEVVGSDQKPFIVQPPEPDVELLDVPSTVKFGEEFWVRVKLRNDGSDAYHMNGAHVHVHNGEILRVQSGDFAGSDHSIDTKPGSSHYGVHWAEWSQDWAGTGVVTWPSGVEKIGRAKIRAGQSGRLELHYRGWMRDYNEYIYRDPEDPNRPDGTETRTTLPNFMDYATYSTAVTTPPKITGFSFTTSKTEVAVDEWFKLVLEAANIGGDANFRYRVRETTTGTTLFDDWVWLPHGYKGILTLSVVIHQPGTYNFEGLVYGSNAAGTDSEIGYVSVEACPLESDIRDLDVSPSTAKPGETLTISYDVYGTGAGYPYETQTILIDGEIVAWYQDDFKCGTWNSVTRTITAPATLGEHTLVVRVYGCSKKDGCVGLADAAMSKTFVVRAPLGVRSAKVYWRYDSSVIDASHNDGSKAMSGPIDSPSGTWSTDIAAPGDAREGQTLYWRVYATTNASPPTSSWSPSYSGGLITDDDITGPSFTEYWDSGNALPGTYYFKVRLSDPSGIKDDSTYPRIYYRWDNSYIDDSHYDGYLDADWNGSWYTASLYVSEDREGHTIYWKVLAADDDNTPAYSWSPVQTGGTIQDDDTTGPSITNVEVSEYLGNGDGLIDETEQVKISWSLYDPSGIKSTSCTINGTSQTVQDEYYVIAGPYSVGMHNYKITATDDDNSPASSEYTGSFEVIAKPKFFELYTYPDLDYAHIYEDMLTELKLKTHTLIGPRHVLIYPVVDGTKVDYDEIFTIDGTQLQIVWGGHHPEGFELEEDDFNPDGDALAYFHVIHWGGTEEDIKIKFRVENVSTGEILGEKDITFKVTHVSPSQTARYFERHHPEDHYPFSAEPVTPPALSVTRTDNELRVYLDGSEIGRIIGDVDDLNGDVLGSDTSEELRNIFYYEDPQTGEEYWIVRLWFIWLKDGPDKWPDQYPDGECFELWIPKGSYEVKWIETFVHSGGWWFVPVADKAVIIGDWQHSFVDPIREAHTPSPNEHYSGFYLKLKDPTNSYREVPHVTGSANWFGFLERLESSINAYLDVTPAKPHPESPTAFYVTPEADETLTVKVVNDGSVHDKIDGLQATTSVNVIRRPLKPDKESTTQLGTKTTPPLLDTDVPAGKGVYTSYSWTAPPLYFYDVVIASAVLGDLHDTDFVYLIPEVASEVVATETYTSQVSQGQTTTQNFTVEEGTASFTVTLAWSGSDLDLHLYDPLGRHVGLNYETGEVENQIPNASYSGPDIRPEWIGVSDPIPGVWGAEVYGREVPVAFEPYVVGIIKVKAVGIEAKVTEEVNATYNALGNLISSAVNGRIVLRNKEDFTAEEIDVILRDITATNIPNETIHVDTLPPGETTIARYDVYKNPRLILAEDWKSITFEEYVDRASAEGKISQKVATKAKKNLKRLLFGEDNTLVFNITLENTAPETLEDVTLLHPLPEALQEVTVINSEGVTYDPGRDAIAMEDISGYSSISVIVRGVLPKEALLDPSTDYASLAKDTTVTYIVDATLSGVKIEDVRGTGIYQVKLQEISHRTDATIALTDATLDKVIFTKPVRIDAKAIEEVSGVYNATRLVSSEASGEIIMVNRESYSGRYGFDITLKNIAFTSLLNSTLHTGELRPGENVVAEYIILKEPRLELTFDWNTSFDKRLRYGWNETMTFKVAVNNTSPDELRDVSITIPLPVNLTECCELISVEPITTGLTYDSEEMKFLWSGDIKPGEKLDIVIELALTPIKPVGKLELQFNAFVSYTMGKTLSSIEIIDAVGNDFYLVTVESKEHKTESELELSQMIEIEIVGKAVLAWVTDEPNELFMDELAGLRPDVLFKKVHTKSEFLSEVEKRFYSVIFLANTDWDEELTEEEVHEITDAIRKGGPFGRGLMLSGFALKYAPELGEVLGDKYIGSLPMGEPFKLRPVRITENHSITDGYVDATLGSTSWAVRVVSTGSEPLAYFGDIMPGKAFDKPSYLKELPALTASTYGKGSGVLFAMDIGTSTYEDLNKTEWLDLASRAIDWISRTGAGPEAVLNIEKDIHPKVITAKFASADQGNEEKHAMVKITIRNTGQVELFDLNVTETLPEAFILAGGKSSWSIEKLEVGNSVNFSYSVWVPATEAATYELSTAVTALDSRGDEHTFSKPITLEVSLPRGKEKNSSKGNQSSLRLNKHLRPEKVDGEGGRDGPMVRVAIDLIAQGDQPVKAVFVQEYIPEEFHRNTHEGAFTGFGLIWDLGTVEHKKTIEYTLGLPSVTETTTYELRTMVEYQTLEDLKTLEGVAYLTVDLEGRASLEKGEEKIGVKERGKGYGKVHWGRRYSRDGGSPNKDHGREHGKGRGPPENPGPPEDPGNPNPSPPDNPGPPENLGNPGNPGQSEDGSPGNGGGNNNGGNGGAQGGGNGGGDDNPGQGGGNENGNGGSGNGGGKEGKKK